MVPFLPQKPILPGQQGYTSAPRAAAGLINQLQGFFGNAISKRVGNVHQMTFAGQSLEIPIMHGGIHVSPAQAAAKYLASDNPMLGPGAMPFKQTYSIGRNVRTLGGGVQNWYQYNSNKIRDIINSADPENKIEAWNRVRDFIKGSVRSDNEGSLGRSPFVTVGTMYGRLEDGIVPQGIKPFNARHFYQQHSQLLLEYEGDKTQLLADLYKTDPALYRGSLYMGPNALVSNRVSALDPGILAPGGMMNDPRRQVYQQFEGQPILGARGGPLVTSPGMRQAFNTLSGMEGGVNAIRRMGVLEYRINDPDMIRKYGMSSQGALMTSALGDMSVMNAVSEDMTGRGVLSDTRRLGVGTSFLMGTGGKFTAGGVIPGNVPGVVTSGRINYAQKYPGLNVSYQAANIMRAMTDVGYRSTGAPNLQSTFDRPTRKAVNRIRHILGLKKSAVRFTPNGGLTVDLPANFSFKDEATAQQMFNRMGNVINRWQRDTGVRYNPLKGIYQPITIGGRTTLAEVMFSDIMVRNTEAYNMGRGKYEVGVRDLFGFSRVGGASGSLSRALAGEMRGSSGAAAALLMSLGRDDAVQLALRGSKGVSASNLGGVSPLSKGSRYIPAAIGGQAADVLTYAGTSLEKFADPMTIDLGKNAISIEANSGRRLSMSKLPILGAAEDPQFTKGFLAAGNSLNFTRDKVINLSRELSEVDPRLTAKRASLTEKLGRAYMGYLNSINVNLMKGNVRMALDTMGATNLRIIHASWAKQGQSGIAWLNPVDYSRMAGAGGTGFGLFRRDPLHEAIPTGVQATVFRPHSGVAKGAIAMSEEMALAAAGDFDKDTASIAMWNSKKNSTLFNRVRHAIREQRPLISAGDPVGGLIGGSRVTNPLQSVLTSQRFYENELRPLFDPTHAKFGGFGAASEALMSQKVRTGPLYRQLERIGQGVDKRFGRQAAGGVYASLAQMLQQGGVAKVKTGVGVGGILDLVEKGQVDDLAAAIPGLFSESASGNKFGAAYYRGALGSGDYREIAEQLVEGNVYATRGSKLSTGFKDIGSATEFFEQYEMARQPGGSRAEQEVTSRIARAAAGDMVEGVPLHRLEQAATNEAVKSTGHIKTPSVSGLGGAIDAVSTFFTDTGKPWQKAAVVGGAALLGAGIFKSTFFPGYGPSVEPPQWGGQPMASRRGQAFVDPAFGTRPPTVNITDAMGDSGDPMEILSGTPFHSPEPIHIAQGEGASRAMPSPEPVPAPRPLAAVNTPSSVSAVVNVMDNGYDAMDRAMYSVRNLDGNWNVSVTNDMFESEHDIMAGIRDLDQSLFV